MKKLIIEIYSENGSFINSIDYIKNQLEKDFTSWFNENDNERHEFNISEM